MLMLRCGLRVEELVNLTLDAIDYQRNQILVRAGKEAKERIVHISNDATGALAHYLRSRVQKNVGFAIFSSPEKKSTFLG